eukprot:gene16882-23157_t
MLNARLATSTAPAMGRPTRRSWTPAPPVHFAGLDERLARPAAGATYPRDNSEFDEVPERPKMLMLTIMACRNLASLHKVVSDRSQDFDHTHVSASVEKVFELSGTFTDSETDLPQQLMKELGEAAEGCLMNMSGTAVARVLWAFRKVGGTPNSSLVRDIVARTGQTFRNGSSFDILRALAELRCKLLLCYASETSARLLGFHLADRFYTTFLLEHHITIVTCVGSQCPPVRVPPSRQVTIEAFHAVQAVASETSARLLGFHVASSQRPPVRVPSSRKVTSDILHAVQAVAVLCLCSQCPPTGVSPSGQVLHNAPT